MDVRCQYHALKIRLGQNIFPDCIFNWRINYNHRWLSTTQGWVVVETAELWFVFWFSPCDELYVCVIALNIISKPLPHHSAVKCSMSKWNNQQLSTQSAHWRRVMVKLHKLSTGWPSSRPFAWEPSMSVNFSCWGSIRESTEVRVVSRTSDYSHLVFCRILYGSRACVTCWRVAEMSWYKHCLREWVETVYSNFRCMLSSQTALLLGFIR